jgi:hypothetical protein
MRRGGESVFWAAIALAFVLSGCPEDEITRPREDAGLGPPDAEVGAELELKPGMMFSYRGILTYRESIGMESNAAWTMDIQIETVDDRGESGDSTLTFKVLNWTNDIDDWDQPRDFDSWVGRLGPSLPDDEPLDTAVTANLSDPPAIPPPPTPQSPKEIPSGGTFFLDMRKLDTVRLEFTQMHADQQPQAVDPSQNGGFFRLAFSGSDPSLVYYPAQTRRTIAIDYNTKGFLRRLEETIGDASAPPSATCRIELTAGP